MYKLWKSETIKIQQREKRVNKSLGAGEVKEDSRVTVKKSFTRESISQKTKRKLCCK